MRSKNSKPEPKSQAIRSRAVPSYSEEELRGKARELAQLLKPGSRVLLEGPMGSGKTTFARYLLEELEVKQPPEGSPSFAIAHEYLSPRGEIVHIDFYRIKSEGEIEEAGLLEYFWQRDAMVISEWLSAWPELQSQVLKTRETHDVWRIQFGFAASAAHRTFELTEFKQLS